MSGTNPVSRLAPSPTGALHLGNARTFLVNWALARNAGWTLLMRIEDLDGPRIKPHAAAAAIDTLHWLGIDHDGPVLTQSEDLSCYRQAMSRLSARGVLYACQLTRRQIQQAASAPQEKGHELRCPAELRPADPQAFQFSHDESNYRFMVAPETISIEDQFAGPSTHTPHREVGDFVVWTRRGVPAYQLAVVVDDARQGVTDVVRGDDLLPSAARQTLLYRALGLTPPRWWHLPLLRGPDGRRLAKRHGDTRIEHYRQQGTTPERIIGLLAEYCGVPGPRREMSAADFRARFDLDRLPRQPVTFTQADHQWLLTGS